MPDRSATQLEPVFDGLSHAEGACASLLPRMAHALEGTGVALSGRAAVGAGHIPGWWGTVDVPELSRCLEYTRRLRDIEWRKLDAATAEVLLVRVELWGGGVCQSVTVRDAALE